MVFLLTEAPERETGRIADTQRLLRLRATAKPCPRIGDGLTG
jgi:hypothetical protein